MHGTTYLRLSFTKTPKTRSDKYIYRLLLSIAGSLSSLILNPEKGVLNLDKLKSSKHYKLIIDEYRWLLNSSTFNNIPSKYIDSDEESCGESSFALGQLIGKNIFYSILENEELDFQDLPIFYKSDESLEQILKKLISEFHL